MQATNVYRPYRVRDPQIGLIVGAQDHGWAALEVTGYVMQLAGGLLLGLIAGKEGIWMDGGALAWKFCRVRTGNWSRAERAGLVRLLGGF